MEHIARFLEKFGNTHHKFFAEIFGKNTTKWGRSKLQAKSKNSKI